MRTTLLFLCLSTAYIASAVPIPENAEEKVYQRFIQFPDGDGNLHTVDLEAKPDMDLLNEIERNPERNRYFLFTRRNANNGQTLEINDAASIRNSNYNRNVPTVVIAHGWLSNQNTDINPVIRKAFLDKSDVNVIVIDWRRLALADYVTAVRGVPDVGKGLGQFINFLISTGGGNLNNFHIIGFSLGAHVVGNAGRELSGRAARITGLDPAGPLWSSNSNALRASDGVYVEAIHTDGGTGGLGIGSAVGNVDFFPNGGNSQPGCITSICDHNRAWELFAATVTHNHLQGNHCANTNEVRRDNCRGSKLHMGNDNLRKTGSGLYRVNTGRRYPY